MSLNALSIRNCAIIDHTEVELQSGLTVITGETGAGKSILLNALNLLLGTRADTGMIRHGKDSCEVNAEFDLKAMQHVVDWLSERDLNDEENCIIRRVVKKDAASKSYINGRPANMTTLKQLGELLLDLHGQHEHQSLLRKTTQMQLIDDAVQLQFPQHGEQLKTLNTLCKQVKQLRQQQEASEVDATEINNKIDFLSFQIDELDLAGVQDNEFEQLETEFNRLSHAQELLKGYEQTMFQLTNDEQGNVESLIGNSLQHLEVMLEFEPSLKETLELLHSALANTQEANNQLQLAASQTELDPERLTKVEQRIDTLITLARKHHCQENLLGERLQTLQAELDELEKMRKSPEALTAEIEELTVQYQQLASQASERRIKAAQSLSTDITEQMQQLGMQGGQFSVAVNQLPLEQMSSSGLDDIEYLVATNPGSPMKPLNKTASGGELSRISLAIQVITSQNSQTPTLIFDEVDVGVGGGIAEVVGMRLRELGKHAQVICITHLPQVAVQGQQHLLVQKTTDIDSQATSSSLIALSSNQRTTEIARMLGGVDITEKTLAHAQEMLKHAC